MNQPKNVVVYNLDPTEITRESVIGEHCHLIGHKCKNKRKIHLEKHGRAVEAVEVPEHLQRKLSSHARKDGSPKDLFWVKLDNGIILPSDQVIIVKTTLEDLIKNHKSYTPGPKPQQNPM